MRLSILNLQGNKILLIVVLGAIILINYLIRKAPTFPDELTNFFLIGKNNLDFHEKLWLIPACLKEQIFLGNYILMIGEITSGFYSKINNNYELRVLTLFSSLIIYVWFFFLVRNQFDKTKILMSFIILLWPIIFFNTFIFFRPEKFIIFFSIFAIISFIETKKILKIFFAILTLIFFILAAYNHPKSLYFLPVIFSLFYILFLKHKSKFSSLIFITVFFILIFNSYILYSYHSQLWPCHNVKEIYQFNSNYAIDPFLLVKDPLEFINKLYAANNFSQITKSFDQLYLKSVYDINYLPSLLPNNFFLKFLSYLLNTIITCVVVFILFANLQFFRNINRYQPEFNVFYVCFASSVLITFLFGASKATYDVTLFVSQIVIIYPLLNEKYKKYGDKKN